jgi:hypothetical protein
LQRLRPTGRKDAEPPIDDNPAKEPQAAPLQIPLFSQTFLTLPAGCAVTATTERSPPGLLTKRVDRTEKSGFFSFMKSAYELAMERLEKESPSHKLTDDQRSQLAEIDSLYKSKMAEKELLLRDQIQREEAAGKFKEVESLQQQLSSELRRLAQECESKKESIREGK